MTYLYPYYHSNLTRSQTISTHKKTLEESEKAERQITTERPHDGKQRSKNVTAGYFPKLGKQSAIVLLCLFCACSSRLTETGELRVSVR